MAKTVTFYRVVAINGNTDAASAQSTGRRLKSRIAQAHK